ncbi:hypothetical protein ASE05_00050 [Mesorhizobium sp. Root172]|nr:hypothetical protein ASE05_00050 [Mesorhizobium sp. Root172]
MLSSSVRLSSASFFARRNSAARTFSTRGLQAAVQVQRREQFLLDYPDGNVKLAKASSRQHFKEYQVMMSLHIAHKASADIAQVEIWKL